MGGSRRNLTLRLRTLARLNLLVASSLDVGTVLGEIVRSAAELMDARLVGLWVADEGANVLQLAALSDERLAGSIPSRTVPFGEGALGRAASHRQRLLLTNAEVAREAKGQFPHWEWLFRQGITDALVVPILSGTALLGVLGLGRSTLFRLDRDTEELLDGFVAQSVIAIEHARLHEEADRRRREAEVLAGLSQSINSSLDLDTVLHRVVEGARELSGADVARIALRDHESASVVFRYWTRDWRRDPEGLRIEPGLGLGGQVLLTGRPMRTENWATDPRISRADYIEVVQAEGSVAILVAPIRLEGRIEGLLYATRQTARAFSAREEALLVEVADHAAIAIQNARLFTRTVSLSRRLVEAQEQERGTIAHELHDQVGQDLTAIKLLLQRAARIGGDARPAALGDAVALVDEVIGGVRDLSLDLRPAMLDDLGLLPALEWFLARYRARTGVAVAFEHAGATPTPSQPVATAVFRIVQEALTNVARHAETTDAAVRLSGQGDTIVLEVEDRGRGFEAARVDAGQTAGLSGMRDRARWLGGVMNLAVNARDAMPDGGRLTLATANVELDEAFVRGHPGLSPGPHVMLLVRDTGMGMTADVKARIFEPFFTTKGVGQGTGLGLATVYGIVTRHHGAITVESEPGRGTTFRLFFPRAEEGSEAAPSAEATPSSAPGSPTILVVDAEPGIVDFVQVVLEDQGYRVLTAATSAGALALAASEQGPIDLLVADLRPPDLEGRALTARLRAARPGLRVLYTSAYSREDIEQTDARPLDAPLLTKPFGLVDLSRAVAERLAT